MTLKNTIEVIIRSLSDILNKNDLNDSEVDSHYDYRIKCKIQELCDSNRSIFTAAGIQYKNLYQTRLEDINDSWLNDLNRLAMCYD
jgi:hypothetical protein